MNFEHNLFKKIDGKERGIYAQPFFLWYSEKNEKSLLSAWKDKSEGRPA